ncbi:Demethylmenaquinone methyltransferase [Lasiodiplodia hormozganensis]|uniref:Demethylmenaquinone methyltransferase n=1 Tax=Lasiodiplodia hormozganensis TaxID=869390 RepID=A0AA40CSX3_9PEZI|nr:Demethylmenaquinone methyltransferase [Lasiodiplodia hormozganensis]
MVLLKVAQRKAALPSTTTTTTTTTTTPSSPAYGIDIFSTADQSGNAPSATWANAAAAGLLGTTTTTTSPAAPLPSPSDEDDSRTSSSSSGPIILHTASFTAPLPFRDGVFGVVTSSLAVHNVGRAGRRHALREMARCCRPGGYVLVVDLAGYVGGYAECLRGELGWTDVESAWGGVGVMFGVWPCVVLRARKPE